MSVVIIYLFLLIFCSQPSQMWSYGPSTASVSRPSWWGPDSSSMQSTWSFWRGGLLLLSFLFILSQPLMKEVCPSAVYNKRNRFSLWMNNTRVNGYTISGNSGFTLSVPCCVSLISRVMTFDCNILGGEMPYYSQMFLINCCEESEMCIGYTEVEGR